MRKNIIFLMCFVMLFSVFCTGCKVDGSGTGGGTGGGADKDYVMPEINHNDTLEIKVMDKGYGTKFIYAIKDAYREINPDVTINITKDPNIGTTVSSEIGLGPDDNDTDIYFGAELDFPTYYESDVMDKYTDVDGKANESLSVNLNNFMEYWSPYNSSKKIKDVIDPAMVEMLTIENRTFALPWAAGACGMVYNESIFTEVGVAVPTTTDELIALIPAFKAYNAAHSNKDEIIPFIWAGGNASTYWDYLLYTWWSQYEGVDNFQKYWSLNDGDRFAPKKEYLTQNGQLEALKVLKELVKDNTVSFVGSVTGNTDTIQKQFVTGVQGKRFAMMPNGDWFENEVAALVGGIQNLANFKMMKAPKLSSAITKHGGADKVGDYAFTLATTHNVFIPSYSRQRDLALDFLSFFYSDEGAKLFTKNTGSFLPLKDTSYLDNDSSAIEAMTKFQQSQYEIVGSTDYIYASYKQSPLRYAGGMGSNADSTSLTHPSKAMANSSVTAESAWTELCNFFLGKWDEYMANAGL